MSDTSVTIYFFKPKGHVGGIVRALSWATRFSHVAVGVSGYVFSMNFEGLRVYNDVSELVATGAGEYTSIEVEHVNGELGVEDLFLGLMDIFDFTPKFAWGGLINAWFDVRPKRRSETVICSDIGAIAYLHAMGRMKPLPLGWTHLHPDDLFGKITTWHGIKA